MGGFIYKQRDGFDPNWDIIRLDDLPERFQLTGDNPDLIIRTVLTDDSGEPVPMYQFTGSEEDWEKIMIPLAENGGEDPKDGKVLNVMAISDGLETVGYGFAEFQIPGAGDVTDGSFKGFSYRELFAGLAQSVQNQYEEKLKQDQMTIAEAETGRDPSVAAETPPPGTGIKV